MPAEGETRVSRVAEIALDLRTYKSYAYAVPDPLREHVRPGVRVRVPYGRAQREVEGWCLTVADAPWSHTRKQILAVLTDTALLDEPLVHLGQWISEYYCHPPGLTLSAMLPAELRDATPRTVEVIIPSGKSPPSDKPLTAKQQALLAAIRSNPRPRKSLLDEESCSASVLDKLRQHNLVTTEPRAVSEPPDERAVSLRDAPPRSPEDAFSLTTGQQRALEAISRRVFHEQFRVTLLFGVPGSGKTEVYVRGIREVVARGRQAILLVPEIALATQIVERLARRFARVAVLHSRLTARQRRQSLLAMQRGTADVVIGTRSAVFAPCARLGLIVVDEEQEGSYKNLQAPFYHARDVAIKRGQLLNVPVVLGSGTPSLESWANAAVRDAYDLVELTERAPGARLPEVRVLRTSTRALGQTTDVLSPPLIDELQHVLAQRQQAIILQNRRGYAIYLACERCGLTVNCPRCGTHLILHQSTAEERGLVKCHHCGHRRPVPRHCLDDTCRGALQRSGLGIQRLEEELHRTFPQARLLRLDSDTMRRREHYEQRLAAFERHEADLLLGTQMVAKGLDFPRVRLVGVIDADAALWLPDFRAAEHAFQLLVQVVGRAGRREGEGASLALLQAQQVEAPALQHAARLDYRAFAQEELSDRNALFLPPIARMVRVVLADPRPGRARDEAAALADRLNQAAGRISADIRVDPAEPCVIARRREMFRYAILIRAPRDVRIWPLLRDVQEGRDFAPKVQRLTVDVDPIDMS